MADRRGSVTMMPVQTTESRLVRRVDHRLVAGVAGGLADHTGIRPIWWRFVFLVMTLAGGLGVLIYLLLWWLLPRADLSRSAGQRFAAHFPDAPAWLGVGLLMLGAVLLAGQLGLWTPNVGWAFLLIGLGVVLYRRDAERRSEDPSATASTSPLGTDSPQATSAWASEDEPGSPWMQLPVAPPPPAPQPPRPPRERSPLGWLAFGLALAAAGVLWLLRISGAHHPSLAQIFALPLTILGVGLLVGALVGRGRWTILPGLLLVPIVLLASVITVPMNGIWQNRYFSPRTAADLHGTYEQSGANLVFDFSKLRPGEHPAPVHATMGIGEIDVTLPQGTPAEIEARAGLGALALLGRSKAGLGVTDTLDVPGSDPIVMDLEVGIGQVSVYYAAVARPATGRRSKGNG